MANSIKPPSNRQLKVGHELRALISEFLINNEYYHPHLENVLITIPEVRISPDLRQATAYIILPSNSDQKKVMLALTEVDIELRKYIATNLRLKFVPQVHFKIDDTELKAAQIENIFAKLHRKT